LPTAPQQQIKRSMMKRICVTVLALTCLFVVSCSDRRPDVSAIDINIEIQRLDRDIFRCSADSLYRRYGVFFDYYTEGIINIGNRADSDFSKNLLLFREDSIVQISSRDVNVTYPNLNVLTDRLTMAFKYYRYYFPDKPIPKIYTYLSGFNQSFILTDSVLAIGLDKYLGVDYELYGKLRIYKYLVRNMYPEKIVSDYISTWLSNEWVLNVRKNNDLISKMLYEGKIHYVTKRILPDEADTLIFGFTAEQLRWCKDNEQTMWITLIENKFLFDTNPFTIRKMTEIAPYTADFTTESPGRACNWIGYNIITRYMKNNSSTTLRELMDNDNYHTIFEQAKYKP
jgi:hypothetical protein